MLGILNYSYEFKKHSRSNNRSSYKSIIPQEYLLNQILFPEIISDTSTAKYNRNGPLNSCFTSYRNVNKRAGSNWRNYIKKRKNYSDLFLNY